jgi:hypothetical protein
VERRNAAMLGVELVRVGTALEHLCCLSLDFFFIAINFLIILKNKFFFFTNIYLRFSFRTALKRQRSRLSILLDGFFSLCCCYLDSFFFLKLSFYRDA